MMGGELGFIIAAVAAFIAVAGVGMAVTTGGPSRDQKKRVASALGESTKRQKRDAATLDAATQKRKQVQQQLKELENRQKQHKNKKISLRARLEQSGLDWEPRRFWIISALLGVAAFVPLFITGQSIFLQIGLPIVAALGLPRWYIGMITKSRQKKFSANFADAIDVIVRGVKSGLPLNECLKVIARESPEPIKSEFAAMVEGISVGVDLQEGMKRMVARMPVPELNFFSIVLVIQSKSGGNLAEALSNLSTVLRSRKMLREKISALSSEAKASAWIIGVLPPGVCAIVTIMSPDYMMLMFTTTLGQIMLMGGVTWMFMGLMMMRNMINFKY